jgi:cell division protein DivIC|tara:strand:+ start:459 stop:752 length:294 start_codon:yes stop_codon:yes gene_type:complete
MVLNFFKNKKLLLINLFLVMYVIINLIGGERGLISYFEKKNIERSLMQKYSKNINQLDIVENKNKLLSKTIDLDYLDILYRDKLKYGKKEEILIKLK